MQSNLSVIEFNQEAKNRAIALLERLGDFPNEYTPAIVLNAIVSSGAYWGFGLIWEERAARLGPYTGSGVDRVRESRERQKNINLTAEAETQATLVKYGIINDRTAIEWLEKIAPKIDRDVDRLNEITERHETEMAAFFEDASEWEF
jgi:hypothetical protein